LVLLNRESVMKGFAMKTSHISAAGFLFLSMVVMTGTAFSVTLRGWVIDNDTCLPVANLGIGCYYPDADQFDFVNAGQDGYFEFNSSWYGRVNVAVFLPLESGYVNQIGNGSMDLFLHEGEILDPVILTVQKGALVHGRVVLWDGAPAASTSDRKYQLYPDGRYVSSECQTDAQGYYSCRLPAG
jgi:hypothetical protein